MGNIFTIFINCSDRYTFYTVPAVKHSGGGSIVLRCYTLGLLVALTNPIFIQVAVAPYLFSRALSHFLFFMMLIVYVVCSGCINFARYIDFSISLHFRSIRFFFL